MCPHCGFVHHAADIVRLRLDNERRLCKQCGEAFLVQAALKNG
jgi:hypothetical protein